jgi:ADP-ribosylglycohydrolase
VLDVEDRAAGVLLGLAAGDRIGGPVRMALRVSESLRDCGGFDVSDIAARYLEWWREGAFDTGPTAARVLSLAARGRPFEEAVVRADAESGGMTAGCNPAHRSAPLAMSSAIEDSRLEEVASAEARVTHGHPLAGDVAAAVTRLCRALIRGEEWSDALEAAALGRMPETRRALETSSPERLSPGGFAPEALGAAMWFLGSSESFSTALARSMDFAGRANYCPVLVGAIGGARWGRSRIPEASLHHHRDLMPRLEAAAFALAARWG